MQFTVHLPVAGVLRPRKGSTDLFDSSANLGALSFTRCLGRSSVRVSALWKHDRIPQCPFLAVSEYSARPERSFGCL
jgi:hypothetical protein